MLFSCICLASVCCVAGEEFRGTWQALAILRVVDTEMDEQECGRVIEDEKEFVVNLVIDLAVVCCDTAIMLWQLCYCQ